MKKTNKYFRFGLYTSALFILVLSSVLFLCILADTFSVNIDLTEKKDFSLFSDTKSLLDTLEEPVTFYYLENQSDTDPTITAILESYENYSDKISISYRDPDLYPEFVENFKTPGKNIHRGSVVIFCNNKYVYIDYFSLYEYDTTMQNQQLPVGIIAQQQINSGLARVLGLEQYPVFFLTGHGEQGIEQDLLNQMLLMNYDIKELNLSANGKMPDNNSIIIKLPGNTDFTTGEIEKLSLWIEEGGSFFLLENSGQNKPENLSNFLLYFGIELTDGIIAEQSPGYFIQGNNLLLRPKVNTNEVIKFQPDIIPIIANAGEIKKAPFTPEGMTYIPLLTTSPQGVKITETEILSSTYDLAAAVKTENGGKLVVFSSDSIIDQKTDNTLAGGGNTAFFLDCLEWLSDSEYKNLIPVIKLQDTNIVPTYLEIILWTIISVFVIPGVFIITGIVIGYKRKGQSRKQTGN